MRGEALFDKLLERRERHPENWIASYPDTFDLRAAQAKRAALAVIPHEWAPFARARVAVAALDPWNEDARAQEWGRWGERFSGPCWPGMSDAQVIEVAARCAQQAADYQLGDLVADGWAAEFERVGRFCEGRRVAAPSVKLVDKAAPTAGQALAPVRKRVQCPYWWRRALRRMIAQYAESGAQALGIVCKVRGQPYASNQAVRRRLDQVARNRAIMERTWLINEDGTRATLAELAEKTTANKAIRRGELMTRIRGCEEWADAAGHVGVFLTLTCPSRFHSVLYDGRKNERHQGETPADAQAWLCKMWARTRAKLKRAGVGVYGFRVAEPHHDGCTHWHALLWADDEAKANRFVEIVKSYWLSDSGDEPGAEKHRVKAVRMERGGAAGYIAKYVAKNIDDHQIDTHIDDYGNTVIGPDLLGDLEIKPCQRVEAWASTWRIRQFQAIGQPPVSVWRELRRVERSEAEKLPRNGALWRAWTAAQGREVYGIAADWRAYVEAQGGMVQGRAAAVALAHETRHKTGAYESGERPCVIGVRAGARCVNSARRYWRSLERSDSGGSPWTGVNNCTLHESAKRRASEANRHNRMRKLVTVDHSQWDDAERTLIYMRERERRRGVEAMAVAQAARDQFERAQRAPPQSAASVLDRLRLLQKK